MTFALDDFRRMYADPIRHAAMTAALKATVTPGSTVVDLGSGPSIYGFVALRLGASHVYAIDPDPSVGVGQAIAARNGLAEQMTFHQELSFDVDLPERVDVVIADLRDSLPFNERNLDSMCDARLRYLKAGGVLIPKFDRVFIAPIAAPSLARKMDGWLDNPAGLDMQPALDCLANRIHYDHLSVEQLRSEPVEFATVNYGVDRDGSVTTCLTTSVEITSPGRVDALALWFETVLTDGVEMQSGPGGATIYRTLQLPVFPAPDLEKGDHFEFSVEARFTGKGYAWMWSGGIDGERRCNLLSVVAPPRNPAPP